jgi:hypothetical protein
MVPRVDPSDLAIPFKGLAASYTEVNSALTCDVGVVLYLAKHKPPITSCLV